MALETEMTQGALGLAICAAEFPILKDHDEIQEVYLERRGEYDRMAQAALTAIEQAGYRITKEKQDG